MFVAPYDWNMGNRGDFAKMKKTVVGPTPGVRVVLVNDAYDFSISMYGKLFHKLVFLTSL